MIYLVSKTIYHRIWVYEYMNIWYYLYRYGSCFLVVDAYLTFMNYLLDISKKILLPCIVYPSLWDI